MKSLLSIVLAVILGAGAGVGAGTGWWFLAGAGSASVTDAVGPTDATGTPYFAGDDLVAFVPSIAELSAIGLGHLIDLTETQPLEYPRDEFQRCTLGDDCPTTGIPTCDHVSLWLMPLEIEPVGIEAHDYITPTSSIALEASFAAMQFATVDQASTWLDTFAADATACANALPAADDTSVRDVQGLSSIVGKAAWALDHGPADAATVADAEKPLFAYAVVQRGNVISFLTQYGGASDLTQVDLDTAADLLATTANGVTPTRA